VNGFHYLHEAYTATDKTYTGKVTVPTLWDKEDQAHRQQRVVRDHSHFELRVQRNHEQRR